LEGIVIAEANAWLPCFIEQFNQKFAKCAKLKEPHRPLTESDLELDDIFTWQEPRNHEEPDDYL
jgi:trehalose utilization protein